MQAIRLTTLIFVLGLSVPTLAGESAPSVPPATILGKRIGASELGPCVVEDMQRVIARDRDARKKGNGRDAGIGSRQAIPSPQRLEESHQDQTPGDDRASVTRGGGGTAPTLRRGFQGVIRGDAGQFSYPPDSCGAIGPNHFVEVVNSNFAVYRKSDGAVLTNVSLGSFLPGSGGDSRVLYDQYAGRWVVTGSNFNNRLYLAVSSSSDPMGSWFKTNFVVSQDSDAGCFPDYPTLGLDANGYYMASYMVGCGMTIFAIDKSPLVAPVQSLGTVTAFRNLPLEGAIQPVASYGTTPGEYLISRSSTTALRLRQINGPLTLPTLTTLGLIPIPSHTAPPDVPSLGSSTPLDSVDTRLMNAVYRDGSIWTAHTIRVNGRAACRWYEVAPATLALVQYGTVSDSALYYFFPAISVNRHGGVVLGCSGANESIYASCYFTGRVPTDPPGQMAVPQLLHAGTGPQNNIDQYGRNRFGDYSLTTLDPSDETSLWTIQEYGHAANIWGTWIGQIDPFFDCNSNGINDEADLFGGTSSDCDSNRTPDECDPDCNSNGIADACDIQAGTSDDCGNGVPDECDPDCNGNHVPDDCDIVLGTSNDCDSNGVADECQPDCNSNQVADACDVIGGTSEDCDSNNVPDECQVDCDQSGVPDACELNGSFSAQSGQLSPMDAAHPQSFMIPSPPPAGSVVSMSFTARGDLSGTDEYVQVDINGTPVGNVFVTGISDCSVSTTPAALNVPGAAYNAAVNNGNAAINLVPTAAVGSCPGTTYITVAISYALPTRDCDSNGRLDDCDIEAGLVPDCQGNGVPDSCDIASGASLDANANDIPDECDCPTCPGDVNGDAFVNGDDLEAFAACYLGGNPAASVACHCADLDANGIFNQADIDLLVSRLLGVLGPGTACP